MTISKRSLLAIRDKYLIDANVFMTAHRQLYPFDLAPSFWEQLVERASDRIVIIEEILNAFTKNVFQNENVSILTRLPISTYWTTNYDHLIEDNICANNRKADIKIVQENLATNLSDRDAIVYKMHGDVLLPNQTVLIKDDYETFNLKRGLFATALKGDLISKTFLFVGFSFEDPNLNSVLARIKTLLEASSGGKTPPLTSKLGEKSTPRAKVPVTTRLLSNAAVNP
jgi:hypothetical protein